MADALAGETKTSLDVFEFKIGMFPDDLVRTHAVGKQLQNVTHSHPRAADAGTPAALLRIHRDSFKDLHHKLTSRLKNISSDADHRLWWGMASRRTAPTTSPTVPLGV